MTENHKQVEEEEDDIRDSSSEDDSTDEEMDSDEEMDIMIQMMTRMITPAMKTMKLKKAKWNQSVTDASDTKSPSMLYFMTNYYFYCQYASFVYQLRLT